MISILLYAEMLHDLGIHLFDGMEASSAFWPFLIITFVTYLAYDVLSEDYPIISAILCFISAFTVFVYGQLEGDPFWFVDWENSNIIWFFVCLIFSFFLISASFQACWSNACMIKHIFAAPLSAILGIALGISWFIAAMTLLATFLVNHTAVAMLCVIGAFGSLSTNLAPAIYVDGKGWITGEEHGNNRFHGDDGNYYKRNSDKWVRY